MNVLIRAAHARTVAELEELGDYAPDFTVDGVTCGACSTHERSYGRPAVKHASVAHVRFCYAQAAYIEAESRAERAAEAAATRYFENGCRTDAQVFDDNERDAYFYRSY